MLILKFIFRLLLALLIAALGYWYFSAVFPDLVAKTVAVVLAVIELVGPMVSRNHSGPGAGLKMLIRAGLPLLTWPAGALVLQASGVQSWAERIALAAIAACGMGIFVTHHGQGRDQQHLIAILIAVTIPLYALAVAITDGSLIAAGTGCFAAGIAPLVAKIGQVWSNTHAQRLAVASGMAITGGILTLAVAFI